MTAPDQCCSSVRKFLPRRRPHMTQSGHANRIAAWDSCPRSRAIDLRSSPIQSRLLSFICSNLLTGRPAGTSFFWSVLSEEKEGTPKCSRRPPNQATSCQLCPTACRPVCLPERQRGTSVPAKRSFIDVGNGCYRLDRGVLKVNIVSERGETLTLAVVGSGSIVGELALIDSRPRSASIVAVKDWELSFISRAHFQECVLHPEFSRYLLNVSPLLS